MKIRNLKYFIVEGFKSFWINGLMSLASTMIVIASLLIFGIYILFSLNINYFADQLKEQYQISVDIVNGTSDEDINALKANLEGLANVSGVSFISKEDAFSEFREQLGDSGDILDGLEQDNPLPDSFRVVLTDLSQSQVTAEEIRNLPNVDDVTNNKDITDKIVSSTSVIKNISFWFMILLCLIAIFIIANTIKITVFARKRDINIMKYLGATDAFISWPFVIEGIIIGLIGAIISLGAVCWGYTYLSGITGDTFGSLISLLSLKDVIWVLVGWFALIGSGLGAIGSAISLRRHLHV